MKYALILTVIGIIAVILIGMYTIQNHKYELLGDVVTESISEEIVVKETETASKPIDVPLEKFSIENEQALMKEKYGDYVQVTKEGKVFNKDTLVVEDSLKSKLPIDTEINVYDGPRGKGYQIINKTDTQIIATGYGPDAADFTYTVDLPVPIASTTP